MAEGLGKFVRYIENLDNEFLVKQAKCSLYRGRMND